jgi:hypothetical protein
MGAQHPWPQGVLSRTALAFQLLQEELQTQGIAIGIADYGGLRTESDTTTILAIRDHEYAAGIANGSIDPSTSIDAWRPIAPYTHSFHDYGAAFDIRLKSIPTEMTEDDAYSAAGVLAPSFGLRWGGGFHNSDEAHFELDVTLAAARQLYANETGTVIPGTAGDVSQMLGVDDAGDDSGEGDLELVLEQQDALTGWILIGVALVSAAAIAIASRR